MMRYFVLIPKEELTEDMTSLFLSYRESYDNQYILGHIFVKDIPSIFNNYQCLTTGKCAELMNNNPELWVPEEIR